jgi:hypothetical protein
MTSAAGGSRTHTPLRATDFESALSTVPAPPQTKLRQECGKRDSRPGLCHLRPEWKAATVGVAALPGLLCGGGGRLCGGGIWTKDRGATSKAAKNCLKLSLKTWRLTHGAETGYENRSRWCPIHHSPSSRFGSAWRELMVSRISASREHGGDLVVGIGSNAAPFALAANSGLARLTVWTPRVILRQSLRAGAVCPGRRPERVRQREEVGVECTSRMGCRA